MKFLVLTGYRFGEMAGLRWSDIDWENQCMYVRRTLHIKHGNEAEAYFTTPKSSNSMRRTPLTDEIVAVLKRAQQLQEEWRRQFPDDWVNQDESSIIRREMRVVL